MWHGRPTSPRRPSSTTSRPRRTWSSTAWRRSRRRAGRRGPRPGAGGVGRHRVRPVHRPASRAARRDTPRDRPGACRNHPGHRGEPGPTGPRAADLRAVHARVGAGHRRREPGTARRRGAVGGGQRAHRGAPGADRLGAPPGPGRPRRTIASPRRPYPGRPRDRRPGEGTRRLRRPVSHRRGSQGGREKPHASWADRRRHAGALVLAVGVG